MVIYLVIPSLSFPDFNHTVHGNWLQENYLSFTNSWGVVVVSTYLIWYSWQGKWLPTPRHQVTLHTFIYTDIDILNFKFFIIKWKYNFFVLFQFLSLETATISWILLGISILILMAMQVKYGVTIFGPVWNRSFNNCFTRKF